MARVVLDNLLDLLLVRGAVLLEQVERVGLGGRLRVRLVEQRLDAEQDLLDGDGRAPALLLVQDRQADGARGVDVWVEERRDELACWGGRVDVSGVFGIAVGIGCSGILRTLGRLRGILCGGLA